MHAGPQRYTAYIPAAHKLYGSLTTTYFLFHPIVKRPLAHKYSAVIFQHTSAGFTTSHHKTERISLILQWCIFSKQQSC
jgi:hypothetical protein